MAQTAKLIDQHDFAALETADIHPTGGNVFSPTGDNGAFQGFKMRHAPGFDQTARIAGRINASAISKEEHDAFLNERAVLLKRKYETSLTRLEENRLAYVRWSLDRIEDAKHGADLDILDSAVSEYERFSEEMRSLGRQLNKLGAGRP